jgi:hypothetical protein
MDLAMKSIPKLLQSLKVTPTCEQVQHVVTAINLIVTKLAQLNPPTIVPDHEKKSLFLQSLPSICDEAIQMIHTMNPNLTFLELTERWMASRQSLEFKKAASMGTISVDTEQEQHSMYSQDFAGRGGRYGRGRGREFGRGGRGRGEDMEVAVGAVIMAVAVEAEAAGTPSTVIATTATSLATELLTVERQKPTMRQKKRAKQN